MSADLTVPCTIMEPWVGAQVVTLSGEFGIVVDVSADRAHGISVAHPRGCRSTDVAPLVYLRRDLSLDLTHRPTRLEALVRLAERSGLRRSGDDDDAAAAATGAVYSNHERRR